MMEKVNAFLHTHIHTHTHTHTHIYIYKRIKTLGPLVMSPAHYIYKDALIPHRISFNMNTQTVIIDIVCNKKIVFKGHYLWSSVMKKR